MVVKEKQIETHFILFGSGCLHECLIPPNHNFQGHWNNFSICTQYKLYSNVILCLPFPFLSPEDGDRASLWNIFYFKTGTMDNVQRNKIQKLCLLCITVPSGYILMYRMVKCEDTWNEKHMIFFPYRFSFHSITFLVCPYKCLYKSIHKYYFTSSTQSGHLPCWSNIAVASVSCPLA
jgi:hypothetical protein